MAKKAKIGRPRLEPAKRKKNVFVGLKPSEIEKLDEVCDYEGTTRSEFIRQLIIEELRIYEREMVSRRRV